MVIKILINVFIPFQTKLDWKPLSITFVCMDRSWHSRGEPKGRHRLKVLHRKNEFFEILLVVFLIYRNFAFFCLQALIEVIISSDRQLFVRATILLGDLLHLVSISISKINEEKYRFPINNKRKNNVENAFIMMWNCQCTCTM